MPPAVHINYLRPRTALKTLQGAHNAICNARFSMKDNAHRLPAIEKRLYRIAQLRLRYSSRWGILHHPTQSRAI